MLAAGLPRWLKGLLGAAVLCMIWEGVRSTGLVDPRDLPSIASIVGALVQGLAKGPMVSATLATLFSWGIGLAAAVIIGSITGFFLAIFPRVDDAVRPTLEFVRPIPSVALIPIAIMALGIGMGMQISLIFFASVWPVLFATRQGVLSLEPRHDEVARIAGLNGVERALRVALPGTLPSIATGTRIAASIALALSITVEMLTGRPGLGQLLQETRLSGFAAGMWACVLLSGFLGLALNKLFLIAERFAFPWSVEHRE